MITRVIRGGSLELPGVLPRGDDVDRIVESLVRSDGPTEGRESPEGRAARADQLRRGFEPALAAARNQLAAACAEADRMGRAPRDDFFPALAVNARLERPDIELLALAATVEVGAAQQRLLAWLQDDPGARRLRLGLIQRIGGPTAVAAAAPEGRLARAGLVSLDDDGPWAGRSLHVAEGPIWAVVGHRPPEPDSTVPIETHVAIEAGEPGVDLVMVHGGDRRRRRNLATETASGRTFLVAPMPETDAELRALVAAATIRGRGLVVEVGSGLDPMARRWMERADHLTWVVSSDAQLPLDDLPRRPWRELEVAPAPADADEWERHLPGAEVGRHPLTSEQLHQVGRAYPSVGNDLDAAVRRLASGDIDRLARRRRPRRTWDDLIVPPDRRNQLAEVVARYRHRRLVHDSWGYGHGQSQGVVALFHGPSGTGKTLSAEIIANDLGLDLFTIDLSAMVSKYVGETEKNLEQVFEAASAANVVLLFDEADSLFGKRSEVGDAKDRYANIEVSYLLQRVEAYDGIAVLTTNLLNNIDQAFLRRIDVLVEFDMPEEDERLALWRLGFPPGAPVDGIDLDELAERFKLPGGNIHSVALGAAFLAAEESGPIRTEHVIDALGREYTKMGRLRTREEFGSWLQPEA